MAYQQRYTPVAGLSSSSNEMRENRYSEYGGVTTQGTTSDTETDLENYYDGNISAPHRLSSYSDTFRPVSTASVTAPSIPHRSSDLSYKDLPPSPAMMGYLGQSTLANQNISSTSYWPDSADTEYRPQVVKKSRKKAFIVAGLVVGFLAVIGIVVGVVIGRKGGSNRGVASSLSSSSSGSSNRTTQSDPNDPSNFTKDPRLHQSFWGFAYTPEGSQPPICGATQANVTRDIQILSQLTTRLRLYGANCNETALVMQAIQDTRVNMTIWPAIYVNSDEDAYSSQLTALQDALKTYGVSNVEGIIVGNEYILDSAGSSSNTSSAYAASVSTITSKVASVKSIIQGMNLGRTLPGGTSDAGSILSTSLASGIDFFMANVHPYFGELAIGDAAAWTYDFFQDFDVDVAATASNKPQSYIAETGWPTGSLNSSDASDGAGSPQGDASVANLQTFLDTYVCQANTNETNYFYFEAFDEPWKAQYGGVEPFWGLFDSNRNLKNVTIPSC